MTNAQPEQPSSRLDRIEARLDNLVTITERLVQTGEIQQQDMIQLRQSVNILTQLQISSFQRMEAMLERFLRQSGNGSSGS